MTVLIPKEAASRETRVALIPDHAVKLIKLGADVVIETDAGNSAGASDEAYALKGAKVVADRGEIGRAHV